MSIVLLGSTSGSCTLQEQAIAGNTTITLPTTSGTMALTSDIPTGVSSLNGSTGALKGLTLVSSTSIAAGSTSANITSGMSTAGWYLFEINYYLSASSATATAFGIRTSTNGGSTWQTGSYWMATDPSTEQSYWDFGTSQASGANFYTTGQMLFYTGTSLIASWANINYSSGRGGLALASNYFNNAQKSNNEQINAVQLVRVSGGKTIDSGTISMYYLGQ